MGIVQESLTAVTARAARDTVGALHALVCRADRIGMVLDGIAHQQAETNRLLAMLLSEMQRH